jgi:hypothetical protein
MASCSSGKNSDARLSKEEGEVPQSLGQMVEQPSIKALQHLMAMQGSVGDYQPFGSLQVMAEYSDVVLKARIHGVRQGREVFNRDPTSGDPNEYKPSTSTLLLDVSVEEVLGGRDPQVLAGKFEIETAAPFVATPSEARHVTAAEYAARLPRDLPAVLFVKRWVPDPNKTRVENEDPGVAYLHTLVQGFLLEEDGVVVTATAEPVPGGPKSSLAEVAAELRASAGGGGSVTAVSVMQR